MNKKEACSNKGIEDYIRESKRCEASTERDLLIFDVKVIGGDHFTTAADISNVNNKDMLRAIRKASISTLKTELRLNNIKVSDLEVLP